MNKFTVTAQTFDGTGFSQDCAHIGELYMLIQALITDTELRPDRVLPSTIHIESHLITNQTEG